MTTEADRQFCQPCKIVMIEAAETGDPYDIGRLCDRCRAMMDEIAPTNPYSWLAELPLFAAWMKEHGPKGYSPTRRWLRQERAREWDSVRRFDLALADVSRQLQWMVNEAPGLRALGDLFGRVPLQVTVGPDGAVKIEIESVYRAAAIAVMDPEKPWTGFMWGPPGYAPDPRFPDDGRPLKPVPGHPLDEKYPQPLHPERPRAFVTHGLDGALHVKKVAPVSIRFPPPEDDECTDCNAPAERTCPRDGVKFLDDGNSWCPGCDGMVNGHRVGELRRWYQQNLRAGRPQDDPIGKPEWA